LPQEVFQNGFPSVHFSFILSRLQCLHERNQRPGRPFQPAGKIRFHSAPVIPALTDKDMEQILVHASEAGARNAGYVFLRLPNELKALFNQWLETHYPLKAGHVMSLIRQSRDGKNNDPRFGSRMPGSGPFAKLLAQRFRLAKTRYGLDQGMPPHRLDLFRPPTAQGSLF
jgi:DNA repair photolyase